MADHCHPSWCRSRPRTVGPVVSPIPRAPCIWQLVVWVLFGLGGATLWFALFENYRTQEPAKPTKGFRSGSHEKSLSDGRGGASHAIILLGRMRRPRVQEPTLPGQIETSRGTASPNLILACFHDHIWDCIRERMRFEIERMAAKYTWEIIKDVCCKLLADQMTDEAKQAVKQIESPPEASETGQAKSKESALRLTIANSSFRALRSRLSAKDGTHS